MAVKSHKKRIIILSIVVVVLLAGISLFIVSLSRLNAPEQVESTETVKEKESNETLTAIISGTGELSTFEKYLEATSQLTMLDSTEPYTVLAFSNQGYNNADKEVKEIFKTDSKIASQKDIISYHIINGNIKPEAMTEGQKLKTLQGSEVVVKNENNVIYIMDMKGNKYLVTKAGIPAKNGSIYIVSGTLLPQ